MTRARTVLLVGGALVWLVAGVAQFAWRAATAARTPAWASVLAPLAQAPLARGSTVVLLPPIGQRPEDIKPLLLEAAWQRPDVHWALSGALQSDRPAEWLVTLGATLPPPVWHEVWRQGVITVYREAAP